MYARKNKQPFEESAYRHIYSNKDNLYFHVTKKDICNLCEGNNLLKKENRLTQHRNTVYNDHIKQKNNYERREKSRQRSNYSRTLF